LIGKNIKVNLMNLTKDPKRSNVNLTFKVESVKENKGITKIIGYEIIPATVKRLVKRNRNKINLSFVCSTSDNMQIRIKPLVITKAKTKGSVLTSLRKAIIDELSKLVNLLNFEEFMMQVIAHKLQTNLKKQLKKIYPIKNFEIIYIKLEKESKEVKKETKTAAKEEKEKTKTEEKSEKTETKKESVEKQEVKEEKVEEVKKE